MHGTAYKGGKLFFELYWQPEYKNIVELGSWNDGMWKEGTGCLRDFRPANAIYTGLDVSEGPGVDIRVTPLEPLPLEDNSTDVVVSTSVFEHDIFFWETFLELVRIIRPGGLIYINAPSNGPFHRYPVDCWRFYPDAGEALAKLACRKGYEIEMIESCIGDRDTGMWNDFMGVFHKKGSKPLKTAGFISDKMACTNVRRGGQTAIFKERGLPEDMVIMQNLMNRLRQLEQFNPLTASNMAVSNQQRIAELEKAIETMKTGTLKKVSG